MLKKFEPKFRTGSLYLCSKCGQSLSETPQPDYAEKLKTELRQELKKADQHTKVRVMVSGCLGVCQSTEQAFLYAPNEGSVEVYTTGADFSEAKTELLQFIQSKFQSE